MSVKFFSQKDQLSKIVLGSASHSLFSYTILNLHAGTVNAMINFIPMVTGQVVDSQ